MNISKLDLLTAALAYVGTQEKYLEKERKDRMPDRMPTPLPPAEQAAASTDNADAK